METSVTTFSLATNYLRKDGEKETTWHRLFVFGKTAKLKSNHVTKGTKILVEGRIQTLTYEAKDGTGKRYITEIVVQQHDLLLMSWEEMKWNLGLYHSTF
ncbi:single-stranded DNA-binding protein [Pseudomonadota bacterium]